MKTLTCKLWYLPKVHWDSDPPIVEVALMYRGAILKLWRRYDTIALTNAVGAWADSNGYTRIKWVVV